MTEQAIQVGRFLLQKKTGFESLSARQRLIKVRLQRPKSGILPGICLDPQARPNDCRVIKSTGEPCTKGRAFDDFFCGMHSLERKFGDVRVRSMTRIKEILTHIKFRGEIVKFGSKYEFRFAASNYRHSTKIRKVDDVTLYEWIAAAMRAEERAYMQLKCARCKTPFKQVDDTGSVCHKCHLAICNDCWPEHSNFSSHIEIETDLGKDTEPKPLSNDEYMDWVVEITDDHPDLEDWENDLFADKP